MLTIINTITHYYALILPTGNSLKWDSYNSIYSKFFGLFFLVINFLKERLIRSFLFSNFTQKYIKNGKNSN
jgi:hypothetical protein